MPLKQYTDALKLGQKEYRACLARGESPYLPVLDEILSSTSTVGERDMGLCQIPAAFIIGTRSAGRARMLARNFMPLAEDNSEFAVKWERLCRSHLDEGIRESIKAYEYMNRYYVVEGHKRVSVLRYFDAVTVSAQVTRILPVRDGSPAVTAYYELTEFYRLSGINFIEFSKPGSCERLRRLLGAEAGAVWPQELRRSFTSAYFTFLRAYRACGGDRLSSTPADAMLAFLEIYGFQALCGKSLSEVKKALGDMWEEIALQQESAPIDVKLTPEEKKHGIIAKALSGAESRVLKAAFVHDAEPSASGWTSGHEYGREYVQRIMAGQVLTTAYNYAMDNDPSAVIDRAIADGNEVVFTTSPRLLPAALKAAVAHPEVTVFNCSLNQSHRYIRTYYPRMYEVKYIIGAVAGALAGSDDVGYLCDYPIFGQIAGINAFALGVQMVNPRAVVHLEWSSVGGIDSALRRLTDRGIRLISSQDMVRRGDEWRGLGLSLITNGSRVNLAAPLWQWGSYYAEMLRLIRSRSEKAEYSGSHRALNYYWGLSAGVVDLRCSDTLPPSVRKLAMLLRRSISQGICNPFQGPLYTQSGRILENHAILTPEQIIRMDYLVENVVGAIPEYGQLTDIGKATVDQVGVVGATQGKE